MATSGTDSSMSPSIAGIAIISVVRSPQSSAREKPAWSVLTWWRDSVGRITVPSAMPNTPSGSSRKRSACDSQVCEPTNSSAAITVSSSRLICATDEPNRVGTISRITLRTSGCCQPHFGSVSRSSPRSAGSWNSSCSRPAAITAQPSAVIGTVSRGASHSAPAIMQRLRITGVNAGMPNRWKLFSAPPASAVSDTNRMKGKVSRSRSTVRPNFSASDSAPRLNRVAICGVNTSPSAVTTSSTPPSVPETRAISSFRSACGRVSLTSVNTGTNAVENEPSANSRRMKFGIRNATQKASVAAPGVNVVPIAMSRINPSTRETSVMLLNDSSPRSMPPFGAAPGTGPLMPPPRPG